MQNQFNVSLRGFVAYKPVKQGNGPAVIGVGINIHPRLTQYARVLAFGRDTSNAVMKFLDRGSVVELKGTLTYRVKHDKGGGPELGITIKTNSVTFCRRGEQHYLKTEVVGNLESAPRPSHTFDGTPVSNFDVRLTQFQKGQKPVTIGATVASFGSLADACNAHLYRGRQVAVKGELRVQHWNDRHGNPQTALAVKADKVKFLAHTRAHKDARARERTGVAKAA